MIPRSTSVTQECLSDNKDTLYMLQHGRKQRSSSSFGLLRLDILAFVGVDFIYSPLLGGGSSRCRDRGVLFVFVCLINFLFFGGSFTVWL
ncbi:hypothetical protein EV421DRAFT_1831199 [Armillaria borealis]|uniref:Transmembrane protein n=1 Tax=Armillaria borealis TaxID=47425 RepID=A0AA39J7B1_9AGAR|nr:hypothetical protein EV421DRAFT_1831199 [Armillaria borealis]